MKTFKELQRLQGIEYQQETEDDNAEIITWLTAQWMTVPLFLENCLLDRAIHEAALLLLELCQLHYADPSSQTTTQRKISDRFTVWAIYNPERETLTTLVADDIERKLFDFEDEVPIKIAPQ